MPTLDLTGYVIVGEDENETMLPLGSIGFAAAAAVIDQHRQEAGRLLHVARGLEAALKRHPEWAQHPERTLREVVRPEIDWEAILCDEP